MLKLNSKQIEELLSCGVEKVIVKEHLNKRLLAGEKLRLKLGIDPTGADLHIGHMVVIRKLREFQKLGHQIIIIVGDYTARIGDPSGRDKMREPLTREQVYKNLKTYQKQIGKILDLKETCFAYQSEWFDKVNLTQVLEWAGIFTVQQMIDREMYQKRIKDGNPIGVHEFMYPLMQGYDSVAIKADVEFGGSDQEFNLLVGRTMQEHFGQKPQDTLTTSLLLGTDGRKMSKTYNNFIGVMESPVEMFGKVMSATDEVIIDYFKLTTNVPISEIQQIERCIKDGSLNPRDAKAHLAREIVELYHSKEDALKAEQEFVRVFQKKQAPNVIPEVRFKFSQTLNLTELLIKTKLALSRTEAKRLIEQGGIKIDDKLQKDWQACIILQDGMVVQKGKRGFVKISINN